MPPGAMPMLVLDKSSRNNSLLKDPSQLSKGPFTAANALAAALNIADSPPVLPSNSQDRLVLPCRPFAWRRELHQLWINEY